jgi:uncharacterized damage-inducible protein DinB
VRSLIERVDDGSYTAPARGRFSGAIGSHVRHCLDHVRALIDSTLTGMCTYDRRVRGTPVETCRFAAIACLTDLQDELRQLAETDLERPVTVETQVDIGGSVVLTTSTLGRELMFVVSHTIHHNALVTQLLETRGVSIARGFGVAPATPIHEDSFECAQ